ncbi:MAG TPA: Sua5 family C-terminal domain-containing protein, partial [Phycisphaerales bacterium]|nr:Sua5 family C-terminal domain-containing protein [Phycisphaerales bacterium]
DKLAGEQIAVLILSSNVKEGGNVRVIRMPMEADAYAAHLYDSMREADEMGVARILIERPAASAGVWEAIHDRLKRATNVQDGY